MAAANVSRGILSSKVLADEVNKLDPRRAEILEGGGQTRVAKQHRPGKWIPSEGILRLADKGTFQEAGLFLRHKREARPPQKHGLIPLQRDLQVQTEQY